MPARPDSQRKPLSQPRSSTSSTSRPKTNNSRRRRLSFSADAPADDNICIGDAVLCRELIGVVRFMKFSRTGRPKLIGLELPDPNGNSDGSIRDVNGETVVLFETKPNHAIFVGHKDVIRKVNSFEILKKMSRQHGLMVRLANEKNDLSAERNALSSKVQELNEEIDEYKSRIEDLERELVNSQAQAQAAVNQLHHVQVRLQQHNRAESFASCTSSDWSATPTPRGNSFSESPRHRFGSFHRYYNGGGVGAVMHSRIPGGPNAIHHPHQLQRVHDPLNLRQSKSATSVRPPGVIDPHDFAFSAPSTPHHGHNIMGTGRPRTESSPAQHFTFVDPTGSATRYWDGMEFGEIFHPAAPSGAVPMPQMMPQESGVTQSTNSSVASPQLHASRSDGALVSSPRLKKVVFRQVSPVLTMKSRSAPERGEQPGEPNTNEQNQNMSVGRRWSNNHHHGVLDHDDNIQYHDYSPMNSRKSSLAVIASSSNRSPDEGLRIPNDPNDPLKIVVTPPNSATPSLLPAKSLADEFRLDDGIVMTDITVVDRSATPPPPSPEQAAQQSTNRYSFSTSSNKDNPFMNETNQIDAGASMKSQKELVQVVQIQTTVRGMGLANTTMTTSRKRVKGPSAKSLAEMPPGLRENMYEFMSSTTTTTTTRAGDDFE